MNIHLTIILTCILTMLFIFSIAKITSDLENDKEVDFITPKWIVSVGLTTGALSYICLMVTAYHWLWS